MPACFTVSNTEQACKHQHSSLDEAADRDTMVLVLLCDYGLHKTIFEECPAEHSIYGTRAEHSTAGPVEEQEWLNDRYWRFRGPLLPVVPQKEIDGNLPRRRSGDNFESSPGQ